jgi:two-component system, OmpR family, sensor histidine kinase SenX3
MFGVRYPDYPGGMVLGRRAGRSGGDASQLPRPAAIVPDELTRVLAVLPGASLIVDVDANVLRSTARAQALGLVRKEQIAVASVRELVRRVAGDGVARERELRVRRPPLGRGLLDLRVQVAQLSDDMYLVLLIDLSDERRVDAVRRDFVANVSHELKTPVGALSLLAEAVLSAADDPESVRRFAERMQTEAQRLSNLVNDIIDLSRLQSDDRLGHTAEIEVASAVEQAVEEMRTLALAREIEIVCSTQPDVFILGDRHQIGMAVRNLLSNALAYSSPHTRVAVTMRVTETLVEIDVKDQGIGIPSHDLDRVFERFYRVDPARSRGTGGTGLGLAIVKHVCRNHGGECKVWSEVGVGSTFTLRLPLVGTAPVSEPEPAPVARFGSSEGESIP